MTCPFYIIVKWVLSQGARWYSIGHVVHLILVGPVKVYFSGPWEFLVGTLVYLCLWGTKYMLKVLCKLPYISMLRLAFMFGPRLYPAYRKI